MGLFRTDEEKKQEFIKKGLNYANSNDYDRAVKEFENALKIFPRDEDALFNLGFVYADMQQFGPAYDIFKKLININPRHIEAFNNLGLLFARQNRYSDAIFVYEKGIEHNPDAAVLYNNLGNVYYDTGKYEKALQMFKKSGELDPIFLERLYHLGIDSFIKGSGAMDDAIVRLQASVKQNVNKAKTVHDLGVAYLERHMEDKAIDSFNRALDIDPNYLSAYVNLGYIYQQKEKYEMAVQSFEKAVILNPKSAKLYNTIGLTYDKMDKPDAAVKMYKKAVLLDPTYANSHYMLGQLYQNRGSIDKSVAEFTKHIRIHETGNMVEDAMHRIAEMKSMSFENVKELFNRYIEHKPEGMSKQEPPAPAVIQEQYVPVVPLPSQRPAVTHIAVPQPVLEVINDDSTTNIMIDLPPRPEDNPWGRQNIEERVDEPTANSEYKHTQEGPEKSAFDSDTLGALPEVNMETVIQPLDYGEEPPDKTAESKSQPKQMPIIPVEPVHGSGIYTVGAISPIQPSGSVPLAPRHPITPQGPHKTGSPQEPPRFKLKKDDNDNKPKINRNYY